MHLAISKGIARNRNKETMKFLQVSDNICGFNTEDYPSIITAFPGMNDGLQKESFCRVGRRASEG
jgi:hypothetical protein